MSAERVGTSSAFGLLPPAFGFDVDPVMIELAACENKDFFDSFVAANFFLLGFSLSLSWDLFYYTL